MTAFDIAVRLLAMRDHSTHELRQKLIKRKATDLEAAITRCQELGYLDDRRWAEAILRREVRRGHGPHWIANILHRNRLPRATIRELLATVDEGAAIQALLEGRLKGRTPQKARAALARRGFTAAAVAPLTPPMVK